MAPRTGRPPSDDPRTKVVTMRFTEAEYQALKAAARLAGTTVGPWARARAIEALAKPQRP